MPFAKITAPACTPAAPPGKEEHTGNRFALHHDGRGHCAQLQSSLSRILNPKIAYSKIAPPAAVSASLAYSMAPASGTQWFYPARLRSYIFRLPLLTRIIVLAIVAFWIAEQQSFWNVVQWGALVPSKIGFGTMYRLNTYPLIHGDFLGFFLNLLALTPLMDRFESDQGTLLTGAMFFGPLSTLPGAAYILVERVLLRRDHAIQGASIWVFVLLGIEAMKAYRANPYFVIGTTRIPTWSTPLALLLFVSALIPNTSFLGHLCSLGIGYVYGLGYLKILAPPEKILRWIEGKLNLLGRLPHYVSIDQKTYGRYGVLPTTSAPPPSLAGVGGEGSVPMTYLGSTQRLGP
ncbi:MAG: rhomboid family [Lasallia pustulata]|uniref:rhomboid protease n=1 Tax=Lasallia pustulata TaxID=136370 RepID=A0A5M8PI79_9LECA|nr:MAG: rhomboid family [Lasallia pustulata]